MALILIKITTGLTIILSFLLGVFTLIKNPKSAINRLWFLICLAVGVWGLGLTLLLFVKTESAALICNFVLYSGAVFIPILFFHFISEILLKTKQNKYFIAFGYFLTLVFLALLFNPPLLISGVGSKTGFDFWVDVGTFYYPFMIYFWIYILFSIYLLAQAYRKSDGIIKKRIFYILIASLIGFSGGGTVFLPQTVGIYPFGNFVVFLYPVIITYGIFLPKN